MVKDERTAKIVPLQHPLEQILSFDVEALEKDIVRHRENIKIFGAEIDKSKEQIALLSRYIEIIKANKNGQK